ncbi:hypothetical protein NSA42_11560 [Paeniclostridium sordellii]|uniref:hypothetical protein n=1 Tax=Paraclostridium sordellii TaxID=1505 RepID=UPI002149ADC7|nr:hypothetical protein [Paeniclostridium sordellii]MCR1849918.1 hypothetical protein [Paeniclostridium sordellii]
MKIALICPSNIIYMPYVNNYKKILEEYNVCYDIINWDRFNIENLNKGYTYKDSKIGHKRNFTDYLKYKKFIEQKLYTQKYDKIIIFGIQLSYFLKSTLLRKFKDKYIVDIRDFNKIIKFFKFKKLLQNSSYVVISSHGYREWLPRSEKIIINHNMAKNTLENIEYSKRIFEKDTLNIACIGAIRDYEINVNLINSLKNNEKFKVCFYGEGVINGDIEEYSKMKNIKNVELTGRYEPKEERSLYMKSDLINVLRYNDGINNKTALPNRLYNSAVYGIPMIAFKGTELSKYIEKYNLGLVLESFDEIEYQINKYVKEFEVEKYNRLRMGFLEEVIKENSIFEEKIKNFIMK